jgi:hypothetical protein
MRITLLHRFTLSAPGEGRQRLAAPFASALSGFRHAFMYMNKTGHFFVANRVEFVTASPTYLW